MNRTPQVRTPLRDLFCDDTRRRRGLERVLSGLDGVRLTRANPAARTASLGVDPAHVDVNAVARAVADEALGRGKPFSTRANRL